MGARYSQTLLNSDSELNGAVFSGAWGASFTPSFMSELGVMQRPRPDYDPKGIPLGGFRLYPVLGLGLGDNDNVFSTSSATQGDTFFDIDPSLSLRSQWGRNALSIYGGAQSTIYNKLSSETVTDWAVGSAGRVDFLEHSDIRANVYYDALHEPRTSPDIPGLAAKPTGFSLFHSDLAIDHRPGRAEITVGASLDDYKYQDTALIGGGELNNAGRDEDVYTVFTRGSYDFSPGYSAFIGASYEDRNFIKSVDINGEDRDSLGYRVNVGTKFFISHLVQGQVFVGYLSQNFKAPLKSVDGIDYGANISWYPTPLWTVHVSVDHAIDDTDLGAASATNDLRINAGVDYELLRDVLVTGQIGYTNQDFVGIARHDEIPGAGLQVTWLINHNISLSGQYQYAQRSSNALNQDYSQNIFLFAAKLQI